MNSVEKGVWANKTVEKENMRKWGEELAAKGGCI
jgi:hypothetical protein